MGDTDLYIKKYTGAVAPLVVHPWFRLLPCTVHGAASGDPSVAVASIYGSNVAVNQNQMTGVGAGISKSACAPPPSY